MRAFIFAIVAATSGVTLLFACGGNSRGDAKSPVSAAPSASEAASASAAPPSSGAEPTTTTLALGDGGALQGTKLSTSSQTTIEVKSDAGAPGPHTAEPGRSVKDIQVIVQSRRDEARSCYDLALQSHPGIEGDIDVKWTIDPKGNVTDAQIDASRSTIADDNVGNCIIAIIKRIKFSESAKGFETHAHYPFNFHPHGTKKPATAP